MVVEEEEKCIGNAEKAVDIVRDADTSNVLCKRYAVVVSCTNLSITNDSRTPSWGFHTVSSGGGGDGECDDDRDDNDDEGGH